MEPEDTREPSGQIDELPAASVEDPDSAVDLHARLASGLNRRKFLAAAALGSIVASQANLLTAFAHVDTKSPCTAGDIEVTGGTIVNEPCTCTGTFEAIAQFTVRNDNNSNRNCITFHLGINPNNPNDPLNGKDLLLTTDPSGDPALGSTNIAKLGTTQTMYARLGTIPCGFQGACYEGSVVAFKTSKNQQEFLTNCTSPLQEKDYGGGQCRRLTICIVGFGISVECANGSCVPRSLTGTPCCSVDCGASLNVKITASGQAQGPACTTPLTLSVKRPGEATFSTITLNASGCYVDASPVQGTYTFRATDCNGCFRETTLAVCVSTITTPTVTAGTPSCTGVTTFTVAPCPPASGVTYTLQQVDCATGQPVATPTITNVSYNPTTCTFTATLPLGETTCVRVKASNGNAACDVFSAVVSVAVNAAVSVTLGAPQVTCAGVVTMTATISGGSGTFSSVTINGATGTVSGTGNTRTITLQPALDACVTVSVTVTDSLGCSATSNAQTFKLCATIAAC